MVSIIFTNSCNLKCPYCFARKISDSYLSENNLDYILSLLKNTFNQKDQIGIIGGEPTVHLEFEKFFKKIVNFSKENNCKNPVLFSNGVLIEEYADLFDHNCKILLNINPPEVIKNKYNSILNGLDKISNKTDITIGINLYNSIPEYNYIIDIAKKYNKIIRVSYAAPTYFVNKEEYFNKGKELFLNFCKDIKKNNLKILRDCSQIPNCYFTLEENKLIESIESKRYFCDCLNLFTIDNNLNLYPCFSIDGYVSLKDFNSLDAAINNLKNNNQNLVIDNLNNNCLLCNYYKNKLCSNGCLSFKKYQRN